jgi:hypothetical protein
MEQQSISTEQPKRGRPPAQKVDTQELLERIANLEACIAKIATLAGSANYLSEFGLKRWEPSKSDMTKYKG